MRIKTGEPGSEQIEVRLDGVLMDDTVEADDLEGWVIIFRRHPFTNEIMFDVEGDRYCPLFDRREGSVQITGFDSPGPFR